MHRYTNTRALTHEEPRPTTIKARLRHLHTFLTYFFQLSVMHIRSGIPVVQESYEHLFLMMKPEGLPSKTMKSSEKSSLLAGNWQALKYAPKIFDYQHTSTECANIDMMHNSLITPKAIASIMPAKGLLLMLLSGVYFLDLFTVLQLLHWNTVKWPSTLGRLINLQRRRKANMQDAELTLVS